MKLGVHVSIAGGFDEAVVRAERLACTAMQIFSRSPRGGDPPPVSAEEGKRFDAGRRRAGVDPVIVHAPYIINLASPDAWTWGRSTALFTTEYQRTAALGAQYLVVHVGSPKGQGDESGIAQMAKALTQTLAACQGEVMVLLENTAGSGDGLGARFEQLASIRERVKPAKRVGYCLDTAHLFAAGHPIHLAEGLEQVVRDFDRLAGLEHVKVIHLNDSKVPFGARVDRHWHIGQGEIGAAAFGRIVNHQALRGLPFILETPKSTDVEDQRNLTVVRNLVKASAPSRRTRAVSARRA